MRLMAKRLLKLLAKQMPIHQMRAAMLRWCGYQVGRDAYVGEGLIIVDELSDRGMVAIGDRAAISPRVTLVASSRPNASRIAPYAPCAHAPISIGDDAWLGTGVIVLPGVTIGTGAIVGANSLVTRDVRPYTIVAGSPAREIRELPVPWEKTTESAAR